MYIPESMLITTIHITKKENQTQAQQSSALTEITVPIMIVHRIHNEITLTG